jgi:hypothetical protein
VTLVEQAPRLGGLAAVAGPNEPIVAWQAAEVHRLGVDVRLGTSEIPAIPAGGCVVQCTGGEPGVRDYEVDDGAVVVDAADLRRGAVELPPAGDVVLFDPIGGPIAVALAEELGRVPCSSPRTTSPATSWPAPATSPPPTVASPRPACASSAAACCAPSVSAASRCATGSRGSTAPCRAWRWSTAGSACRASRSPGAVAAAGDCVAPRTVHEAILEGRRAAVGL